MKLRDKAKVYSYLEKLDSERKVLSKQISAHKFQQIMFKLSDLINTYQVNPMVLLEIEKYHYDSATNPDTKFGKEVEEVIANEEDN